MDFLADTGTLSRFSAGMPDYLRGNRMVGRVPTVAREQPHGGFLPQVAIVFSQSFEKIRTQHDVAISAAFAALDVNYIAPTVYIRDLQPGQFGPAKPGTIKRH